MADARAGGGCQLGQAKDEGQRQRQAARGGRENTSEPWITSPCNNIMMRKKWATRLKLVGLLDKV